MSFLIGRGRYRGECPVVFPIGVPVTFNFVIQLASAVANVGIGANGVQINVQEVN